MTEQPTPYSLATHVVMRREHAGRWFSEHTRGSLDYCHGWVNAWRQAFPFGLTEYRIDRVPRTTPGEELSETCPRETLLSVMDAAREELAARGTPIDGPALISAITKEDDVCPEGYTRGHGWCRCHEVDEPSAGEWVYLNAPGEGDVAQPALLPRPKSKAGEEP